MARPKKQPESDIDIRAEVLALLREKREHFRRFEQEGCRYRFPYPRLVEQVEAGEPVRFPRWQLPQTVRQLLPEGDMEEWYELGTDGTLESVQGPVRGGG